MGRLARVVAVDVPHHLTQRGNDRRFILDCDADRATYLSLLRENIKLYQVSVMGYCLMSNHVHLIVVPRTTDGLAQALKQTHGRYASYWNTVHRASGHVWQGRYYSCPLDEPHLWEALRYTELNPLRARLVATPESWSWSSAASHCGTRVADEWLCLERWNTQWAAPSWREYLAAGEMESQLAAIRQRTHTGRPWGSAEFVHGLEKTTQRRLTPQKRGPREKIITDRSQPEFTFEP
jgi:putative transposase